MKNKITKIKNWPFSSLKPFYIFYGAITLVLFLLAITYGS